MFYVLVVFAIANLIGLVLVTKVWPVNLMAFIVCSLVAYQTYKIEKDKS